MCTKPFIHTMIQRALKETKWANIRKVHTKYTKGQEWKKERNVNIIKEAVFLSHPISCCQNYHRISAPNCGHHLYLAAETKIGDVQILWTQINKHLHTHLKNHRWRKMEDKLGIRQSSLPSLSNGQMGVEGSHTAQSFDKGTKGPFCPHKMDSVVQPSRDRGSQWVNDTKSCQKNQEAHFLRVSRAWTLHSTPLYEVCTQSKWTRVQIHIHTGSV